MNPRVLLLRLDLRNEEISDERLIEIVEDAFEASLRWLVHEVEVKVVEEEAE